MNEKANGQTLLTGATLFTGTSEEAIEDGTVLVDGEHIAYAGPAGGAPKVSDTAKRVDVGGRFIMPGMTESHAHLSFTDSGPFNLGAPSAEEATMASVRNARRMLGVGFTSAISFGSVHKVDVTLRDAINEGKLPGPRLRAAGRDLGTTACNIDSPGGLSMIADGPVAMRKAVREQRKDCVDIVKLFIDGEGFSKIAPPGELSFTDEEVEAATDEAHRRHMRVAVHARCAEAVKQAVRAGVDLIGHANYLDDEALAMLKKARDRVFVGPAIAWEVTFLENCESLGISIEVARERGYEREVQATIEGMPKMEKAGIRLLIGGDYGISIAPHGTYAKDLEYFTDMFGMTPGRALLCATRDGGKAYDPDGDTLGTLEDGKLADLLVVDGNPLTDITVLQEHSRINAVMKGGHVYVGLHEEDVYTTDPAELFPGTKEKVLEAAE